jgi:hypothetical protein
VNLKRDRHDRGRGTGCTHLEAGNTLDDGSENVKLLLGTLIIIPLPLEPDPDSSRGRLDTSRPNGLVESWRDTDIVDTHRLLCELLDGLDGVGGLYQCISISLEKTNKGSLFLNCMSWTRLCK